MPLLINVLFLIDLQIEAEFKNNLWIVLLSISVNFVPSKFRFIRIHENKFESARLFIEYASSVGCLKPLVL